MKGLELIAPTQLDAVLQATRANAESAALALINGLPKAELPEDPEAYQVQSKAAGMLQKMAKNLNEERLAITRPLMDAGARIKQVYDRVIDRLTLEKKARLDQLQAYDEARAKEAAEAAKKLEDLLNAQRDAEALRALERGKVEAAEKILSTPVAVPQMKEYKIPETGNYYRQDVEIEVFDEDEVPRCLCSPDMAKIRRFLHNRPELVGKPEAIAGVKSWIKKSLIQRGLGQ